MTEESSRSSNISKPSKKPGGCSNVLVLLLIIAFVFSTVTGVVGFNIWRVLFNPTLVKHTLTNEFLYSDLTPSLLAAFSEWRAEQRVKNNEALSGVSEPDIVLLISYIDMDGWRRARQLLVSDEFITNLVSVSVDGLYQWIDSEDPWPTIIWDMTLLKARMTGEEGVEAIMIAYTSMPICTEEEIADLERRLASVPPGVEVLYNLCQFPDPWHEDQVNDYINTLLAINSNIPMRYNFSDLLAQYPAVSSIDPQTIKTLLRAVRFVAQWGWVVALLLLGIILAIRVRSRRSLGQFVGIPLAISGILTILVDVGGQASIINFISRKLLSAVSPLVYQEVTRGLRSLTSVFFQPMLLQGIILTGVGLVLIFLMFIKKQAPSEGDVQEKVNAA